MDSANHDGPRHAESLSFAHYVLQMKSSASVHDVGEISISQ